MTISNVIFFLPCKQIGGSQYLFIRYAKALARYYSDYKVYYVDYTDGFARTQIHDDSGIIFIDYKDNEKVKIPSESIVFNTLNHLWHFNKYIEYNKSTTRFLFWCVNFADVYLKKYIISKANRKKIGLYLSILSKNGTICYLAEEWHFLTSSQYTTDEFNIIPLPLLIDDSYNKVPDYCQQINKPIRFCWLGRIDDDKLNDILSYVNELEKLSKTTALSLSFIGKGDKEQYVRDYVQKVHYAIDFVGELREENLDLFIRNRVDIGLASGTSSLEFSLRGKPTIQLWKAEKPYSAGECTRYHLPEFEYDREKTTAKKLEKQGQTTFEGIFRMIENDYYNRCRSAYNNAEVHLPQNGAELIHQHLQRLQLLDPTEVNKDIEMMAHLLSIGRKRTDTLVRIRSMIFKLFRK